MAANIAMAAARNPALQQAAFDAVQRGATATMDTLMQKEREVAARMQDLKQRQERVLQELQSLRPNWPPQFCCIGPVVYHDISRAVPADRIGYAKSSYTTYFITIFVIFYNIICAIAAFASEGKDGDKTPYAEQMGVSLVHLLGIPGAFLVWHFQVYKAVQPRGQLTRYGTAYLGICIAFVYNVFMAVGLPGYGGCGFLFAFACKQYKTSAAPFYMSLICAIIYCGLCIYFIFSFFRLRKYHRQDKSQTVVPGLSLV
jgi:hypothetical protein